jgi:hypothetical protein
MGMLDEDEEFEDEVLAPRHARFAQRAPRARCSHTLDESALDWSPKFEVMASSMRCDGVVRLDERSCGPPFSGRCLGW